MPFFLTACLCLLLFDILVHIGKQQIIICMVAFKWGMFWSNGLTMLWVAPTTLIKLSCSTNEVLKWGCIHERTYGQGTPIAVDNPLEKWTNLYQTLGWLFAPQNITYTWSFEKCMCVRVCLYHLDQNDIYYWIGMMSCPKIGCKVSHLDISHAHTWIPLSQFFSYQFVITKNFKIVFADDVIDKKEFYFHK